MNIKDKNIRGFSLLEAMITVAVIAILGIMAAPSFDRTIDKRHIKGAAEDLYASIQFAKMEALKRSATVRVDFTKTSNTVWCYGVSLAACDCTNPGTCVIDGVERVTKSTDYKDISLDNNPWGGAVSYAPFRGTMNAGNATFYSNYAALRVLTVGIGRVRICAPSGAPKPGLEGYTAC